MSAEPLDDAEFLLHVARLANKEQFISPEVVIRLQRMAYIGTASPAALSEARLAGLNEGRAAERARRISHFPGDDLDPKQDPVLVVMSRRAATEAGLGLSDLLCWCRGFVAALPEDLDRHPMSWEVAREVNIALRRAIEASE